MLKKYVSKKVVAMDIFSTKDLAIAINEFICPRKPFVYKTPRTETNLLIAYKELIDLKDEIEWYLDSILKYPKYCHNLTEATKDSVLTGLKEINNIDDLKRLEMWARDIYYIAIARNGGVINTST